MSSHDIELLSQAYAVVGATCWLVWLLAIHSHSIKVGDQMPNYVGNMIFVGVLLGCLMAITWPVGALYSLYRCAFVGP